MLGFIILSFSVLNPVSVFASQSSVSQPVPVVKKRRGRPPGSKNKPKEVDELSRLSSSVLPSSIPCAHIKCFSGSISILWNGKTTDLKMSCGGNSAEETVKGRAMKPQTVDNVDMFFLCILQNLTYLRNFTFAEKCRKAKV